MLAAVGHSIMEKPTRVSAPALPCVQITPKWSDSRHGEVWLSNAQGWGMSAGGAVTLSHPRECCKPSMALQPGSQFYYTSHAVMLCCLLQPKGNFGLQEPPQGQRDPAPAIAGENPH